MLAALSRRLTCPTLASASKSFGAARDLGEQNQQAAYQNGRYFLVDVQDLHDHGVDALDLPAVPNDYLVSLGYTFQPLPIQTSLRKPPAKAFLGGIQDQPSAADRHAEFQRQATEPKASNSTETNSPKPKEDAKKSEELHAVVDILNCRPVS